MTTAEQPTETLAEKRRRLKAERDAAQVSETPADGAESPNAGLDGVEAPEPPDDDFDSPNRLAATPEDVEIVFDPSDPSDPIIAPPSGGRTGAGVDPQLQMDEIVLSEEEHAELLINLEALIRLHEGKLLYDRAHREAWEAFKGLGHGEGKAKAFRLGKFRIIWPDKSGDSTHVSYDREPMQKVSVTEIKG